jgi:hypothetical protein
MALLPTTSAPHRKRGRKRGRARGLLNRAAFLVLLALGLAAWRRLRRGGSLPCAAAFHGPEAAQVFPPRAATARELLLATHGRLMWYAVDTGTVRVLHEGSGVYYGVFPGDACAADTGAPASIFVVSRPDNWRPAEGAGEWILELDAASGAERRRVRLASRFTHDAVRRRDRVYVADTEGGAVRELAFPSLHELRAAPLFTPAEHVNTLSPNGTHIWAMLHNKGPSALAEVDLRGGGAPREARRLRPVGAQAHGAVRWGGGLLALDSKNSALMRVDLASGATEQLWAEQPPSAGGTPLFLKGLAVVDDVAYFGGAARRLRRDRADPSLSCDLLAYDLRARVLLWRRTLPTRGLVNVVAAPQLQVESTAAAVDLEGRAPALSYRATPQFAEALAAARAAAAGGGAGGGAGKEVVDAGAIDGEREDWEVEDEDEAEAAGAGGGAAADAAVGAASTAGERAARARRFAAAHDAGWRLAAERAATAAGAAAEDLPARATALPAAPRRSLTELEPLPASDPLAAHPPRLGGRWASGLPRLDLAAKGRRGLGLAAGAQLRLARLDVSELKRFVLSLPDADWEEAGQRASNAWLAGREGNLAAFKPGATTIHLVFSDQAGETVFEYPWLTARFAPLLAPLLDDLLGADVRNIIRMQLARMPAGGSIKRHVDKGGYSAAGHRLHLVVASSPAVTFEVCERGACLPLHVEEGLAFELNNRLEHSVRNGGAEPRVHLVVDVAEGPRARRRLKPGQVCLYVGGDIDCGLEEAGVARAA